MKTENTSKISKAGVGIRRRPLVRFYPQNDDADELFLSDQHWLGLELCHTQRYILGCAEIVKQSLGIDSEFFDFLHDSEWSPLKGSIPYIQALFRMLSTIQGLVASTTFDFDEKVTLIETLPDLLLTLHLYQVKLSSGSSLSDRVEWSVIYKFPGANREADRDFGHETHGCYHRLRRILMRSPEHRI